MNRFLQKDWLGQCQVYVVQGKWEAPTVKWSDQYFLEFLIKTPLLPFLKAPLYLSLVMCHKSCVGSNSHSTFPSFVPCRRMFHLKSQILWCLEEQGKPQNQSGKAFRGKYPHLLPFIWRCTGWPCFRQTSSLCLS